MNVNSFRKKYFTFVNFYDILFIRKLRYKIMGNDVNDIAEKIKKYRKLKNMSQDELAEISGINVSTIKKYECGIRNPKPEQLLKMANALGVSMNTFLSYEIKTISDVLSILIKLDEQTDLNIIGNKDESGKYIPSSIKLSFDDAQINDALSVYLLYKEQQIPTPATHKMNRTNYNITTDSINMELETQLNQLITSNSIIKKPE